MNKKDPLLSIVIPTHNRLQRVSNLITDILNDEYKNTEIIVIDDASTDNTLNELTQKYKKNKKVKILHNKTNLYAAASRNRGMKKATGELIFFIDDDNVITPSLIKNLVCVLSSDEKIGEVGPMMYFYTNKKKIYWAGTNRDMTTSRTYFTTDLQNHKNDNIWETDDVLNAFMVKRTILEKYKISFKDKFGIMYEESDFAYRIKQQGYSIKVVKNAIIYHDTEDFSKEKGKTAYLYHTMNDKRRAYFTARNRLVFHTLYSTKMQLLGIVLLWNWLFAGFYLINIILYEGPGNFNLKQRLLLCFAYLNGIHDGLRFILSKEL